MVEALPQPALQMERIGLLGKLVHGSAERCALVLEAGGVEALLSAVRPSPSFFGTRNTTCCLLIELRLALFRTRMTTYCCSPSQVRAHAKLSVSEHNVAIDCNCGQCYYTFFQNGFMVRVLVIQKGTRVLTAAFFGYPPEH